MSASLSAGGLSEILKTMVSKNIDFDHGVLPIVNGVILRRKDEIVREIYDLCCENGYDFHPFFRPVPPCLVNYKDVTIGCLVALFKKIWEYCILFEDECLHPEQGVVINSFGLNEAGRSERVVVIEESATGHYVSYPVTLSTVSSVVERFLSRKELLNKMIVIK